jgi:hypothetical protein
MKLLVSIALAAVLVSSARGGVRKGASTVHDPLLSNDCCCDRRSRFLLEHCKR